LELADEVVSDEVVSDEVVDEVVSDEVVSMLGFCAHFCVINRDAVSILSRAGGGIPAI